MVPMATLDKASNIRDIVNGRPRLSVTDLARSKDWRDQLPHAGIIEVTDRGETAAWLLSDEDMKAMVESYTLLEQELERAQVAAMFRARESSHPKAGKDLSRAAVEVFEARKDELAGIINGR